MEKDLKNIPASVRQRLANLAKDTGRPFNELLQYYGMERFLYRVSLSEYTEKFILKGALMLVVWKAAESRPTRDIDFLGFTENSLEDMEEIIRSICEQVVEDDGVKFAPESVRAVRIKEDADYEGVRVTFTGYLANAKIPMQLDIGFGDIVSPAPDRIEYPVLLDSPTPN